MKDLYYGQKNNYENIKRFILDKKTNVLNEKVIDLYSKYFSSLDKINVLPSNINIMELVDKALNNINDCVFYNNNDDKLLKELGIGKKNKGIAKDGVLYVNNNQTKEMVEITFYHELTHLIQNHSEKIDSEDIGLMQHYKYRLIMEAQTQFLAEMIYSDVQNEKRFDTLIDSDTLRMVSGGMIRSNLRNYELYGCILEKMCLFLNISKEEIIKLNFMGENGCKKL